MRRIMLLGTLALVTAAMLAASALPTFAKQAKTGAEGQQVGEEGTCTPLPGTSYPTIQSAVDDPSCETIQLEGGFYTESTTIDRDVTIIGASDEPTHVGNLAGSPVFTILPGATVTLEDLHIEGATGEFDGGGIHNEGTLTLNEGSSVYSNLAIFDGGGIYNLGTLTLNEGSSVHSNVASEEGGGIYNEGTLYLCGGTVSGNHAPRGTVNDISGDPAQECPTTPPPGGTPEEGGWVLVDHKGKKELCLPEAALNGHLKHGDEVISEEGCSDDTEAGGRGGPK